MTPLEPVQIDLDLLDRVFHPSLCTTDPESGTWCGSSWKPLLSQVRIMEQAGGGAMSDRPLVLSMCDRTGVMVEPWLLDGYECWIVDMQHEPGIHREGALVRVGADVSTWLPPRGEYRIVFGFPPCTNLAISGSRWFQGKGLAGLADGLRVVEAVADRCAWSGAPWMLENPVSTISSYWRKPDFTFDPCDYGAWVDGDAYVKKTCLWTGGGFIMPPPNPVAPVLGSKMHLLPPSNDRGDLRSVTPAGFARAVFEANENGITTVDDIAPVGLFGIEAS